MAVYDSSVTGDYDNREKTERQWKNERKPLVRVKCRPIEHESQLCSLKSIMRNYMFALGQNWAKTGLLCWDLLPWSLYLKGENGRKLLVEWGGGKAMVAKVRNSKCRGEAWRVCAAFTSAAFEA